MIFDFYLIIVDSDNGLRVDSRNLMVDLFEWQARKFIDNWLFSLKLSSFECHTALVCVHIGQFSTVLEIFSCLRSFFFLTFGECWIVKSNEGLTHLLKSHFLVQIYILKFTGVSPLNLNF